MSISTEESSESISLLALFFSPILPMPSHCCSYFKRFGKEIEWSLGGSYLKREGGLVHEIEQVVWECVACIHTILLFVLLPSSSHSLLPTAKLSASIGFRRTRPPLAERRVTHLLGHGIGFQEEEKRHVYTEDRHYMLFITAITDYSYIHSSSSFDLLHPTPIAPSLRKNIHKSNLVPSLPAA